MWGGSFFPQTVIKDPLQKKNHYWPHGNENTLTINFFFFERERKEDRVFDFQAFKVILNSINTSNKTNAFKLAILWSVGGGDIRKMGK